MTQSKVSWNKRLDDNEDKLFENKSSRLVKFASSCKEMKQDKPQNTDRNTA